MKILKAVVGLFALTLLTFCGNCESNPSSDQIQSAQQEQILKEGTSAVGMPAIKNFRERRILKDIYEMRDQDGLSTWTYIVAEQTGKLVFLGRSVGYGVPASTQFTNPQKIEMAQANVGIAVIPQADPNGLFSPSSADGTWVMMKDPNSDKVLPVYIEPRVIVSPFPLTSNQDVEKK